MIWISICMAFSMQMLLHKLLHAAGSDPTRLGLKSFTLNDMKTLV